jgi:calcineurin-like phosphoesterase family protein
MVEIIQRIRKNLTCWGKKAINVGVDVQNFLPVSIKRILEIAEIEL